jgi:hypothetical protein
MSQVSIGKTVRDPPQLPSTVVAVVLNPGFLSDFMPHILSVRFALPITA